MARRDPYRVIQWSTGQVGVHALRGIIEHPDLELVGVWVHSPAKAGLDAGELCGLPPVGVPATGSVDELLALDADCVCYTSTDTFREHEVVDELVAILSSGKNVVGTSMAGLVFPLGLPDVASRLAAACEAGQSSLHITGVNPGLMLDALPLVLSSGVQKVESVMVSELLDISTYSDPTILGVLGFGRTPEDDSPDLMKFIIETFWSSAVRLLGEGLGIEFDELRTFREVAVTKTQLETASFTVEPGMIGAVRMGLEGVAAGRVVVTLEEVLRLGTEVAPDWPQPPGRGGYRIEIKGVPQMRAEISLDREGSDPCTEAVIVTGMRAVNSIPAVCDAPSGLHTFLTLPPWAARSRPAGVL